MAILDHTAELGGAELALLRLLDALTPDLRIDPHVVLFSDGPLVERLRASGHSVEVLPLRADVATASRHDGGRWRTAARAVGASAPFVRRLAARLRELDLDLVHTTSLKADLLGVPAARMAGLPLVWHVHDRISTDYLPGRMVRLVRHLAARSPRRVVVNSHATAATLPGARGLTVVPPGLAPDQVREVPRPRPTSPVVGILGRISPTKGQMEFVHAAAQVAARHPDATFRIIGAPAFGQSRHAEEVAAEISRLGMTGRIVQAGFSDDPAAELDRLVLAVHASPVPEPYGQVVAEAMGRGVPIVATKAGGVTEVVGDDDVGWLVAPGDVRGLAEAMDLALEDPEEAERRGHAGWRRARRELGVERTARTVATVWREVAGHQRPRVAIAHDYLTQRGGAERVVLAILRAFPDATIHTTLYDPEETFPEFRDADIRVSPLNKVGVLRRNHRVALPFLPFAASRLHIDADVVVASSSGWAHAFPTSGQKLVYCHAPARWLYQSERYLGFDPRSSPIGMALLAVREPLKIWDQRAARTGDAYLANSHVVRERIGETYGIDADVLAPPFAVDATGEREPVEEVADWEAFHLVVSRLLPYKNVHLIIEAFRDLPERLVVVGAGPMLEDLRASAPPNVAVVTRLSDAQMRWTYARATALVAASHEDFGLTPLEAGAFGKPALALRAGGFLDTIAEGVNGSFFDEPEVEAIRAAVRANRGRTWDEAAIRAHVEDFSPENFVRRLRAAATRLTECPHDQHSPAAPDPLRHAAHQ